MTVIKVFILSQIPADLTQTATDFCCTISLYCERNNLLFNTFLMHSIWWNGLYILQRNLWHFVWWCCHFGNRFNQCWLIALIELLYFYARKQLLLSSRFSHRNSVHLFVCLSVCSSHGWISQKQCLHLANTIKKWHCIDGGLCFLNAFLVC